MASRRPSLLLDVMCGKLTTYLRMCGYDAGYALDRSVEADDEILAWAEREDRVVITRDVELANRAERSLLLSSLDVVGQLSELAAAGFELSLSEPSRCATCNGRLVRVGSGEETPEYAPNPDERSVWRCVDCGQYFWRGSHWTDVAETLAEIESGN